MESSYGVRLILFSFFVRLVLFREKEDFIDVFDLIEAIDLTDKCYFFNVSFWLFYYLICWLGSSATELELIQPIIFFSVHIISLSHLRLKNNREVPLNDCFHLCIYLFFAFILKFDRNPIESKNPKMINRLKLRYYK